MAEDAPEDDGALVRRALAREPEALGRFVQRLRCVARILHARNARSGTPFRAEELEDLTQDALAAVWRKLPGYDGRSRLETWAYRFCELEFLRRLRTRRRGRLVLEPSLEGSPHEPLAPPVPAAYDDEALWEGLEALDEEIGVVLRLKHCEDLTFEAIGARLGVSVNTAKTRYYRGLQKLRRLLAQSTAGRSTAART